MTNDVDPNPVAAKRTRRARAFSLSPRRAFLTLLAAGFVPLLVFQLSGRWPGRPDLFDYRSATIGDGLLLPLLTAFLVAARGRLPRAAHEKRIAAGAAAIATALAGWILWNWYQDPHPHTNWTLPRAHHLTFPGYWHTGFFLLAAAALSALTVSLIWRIRRAPLALRQWIAESSLLFGVLFAGFGYIGLAVVDDLGAAGTQAGRATAVGIGFGALLGVALLWSLQAAMRPALPSIFAAAAAALGLALLAHLGLVASGRSLSGCVIVAFLVVGLGAEVVVQRGTALLRPRSLEEFARPDGVARLVATALVLLGGLSFALGHVETRANQAAIALALAALAAVIINPFGDVSIGDRFLLVIACAYTVGLVVLADWLEHHQTNFAANYSLGFSSFFVDGLVVGLIRSRFKEVVDVDKKPRSPDAPAPEEVGPAVLAQIFGLGGAALGGLLLLYVTAAPILGLDQGTVSFPISLRVWVAAELAAIVIAALGLLRARRRTPILPQIDFDEAIRSDLGATTLSIVALLFSVGPLILASPAPSRYLLVGLIPGAALAGLTVEDVLNTGAGLHLRKLDGAGWLLAFATGAVIGLMQWWVLTTGLWGSSGKPVTALWTFGTSFLLPLTITIVSVLALAPVAYGLDAKQRLTAQETISNLVLTRVLYSFLGFLAFTIPVLAVGRLLLVRPSDAGLVAISSLAIMPSLIGAFLWVVSNNVVHLRGQEGATPVGLEDLYLTNPIEAAKRNSDRLDRLAFHTKLQNRAATAIFALAGAWLAWYLLR
jgi:hypothetical protein